VCLALARSPRASCTSNSCSKIQHLTQPIALLLRECACSLQRLGGLTQLAAIAQESGARAEHRAGLDLVLRRELLRLQHVRLGLEQVALQMGQTAGGLTQPLQALFGRAQPRDALDLAREAHGVRRVAVLPLQQRAQVGGRAGLADGAELERARREQRQALLQPFLGQRPPRQDAELQQLDLQRGALRLAQLCDVGQAAPRQAVGIHARRQSETALARRDARLHGQRRVTGKRGVPRQLARQRTAGIALLRQQARDSGVHQLAPRRRQPS
jgi:hypothetical protein